MEMDKIHVWKYLKTVDFMNTKIIMFRIIPFLHPWISQQILNNMNLKIKVKVMFN